MSTREKPGRLPSVCVDDRHTWWVLPLPSMSGRKVEECSKCRMDRKLYEERLLAEIEEALGD